MKSVLNRAELARFMRNIEVDPSSGCWEWKGGGTTNGYGTHQVGPGKPKRAAHRISYEHHVDEVPSGFQIDHICRNRACVNPDHLEPVTPSENTRRQDHAERRKTECPKGHPYSIENTRVRRGKRECLECERERDRRRRGGGQP